MDWVVAGAAGQVVASLGVVASVFYLGFQVRQSARATRAAMYQSINMHIGAMLAPVFQSPEAAGFLEKALADLSSLSPVERLRFTAFCSMLFRHYDAVYCHFKIGTLAPEQWGGFDAYIRVALERYPGLAAWWKDNKGIFSSDFAALIDDMLGKQAVHSPNAT